MANLNKVLLMGNLTRDPEIKRTPKGTAVADLGLAINRKVPDGNDGWKNEPTFVDITVWGNAAENAHKYLTKGRGIFVEGRLQLEQWTDKESGAKRSKLKIIAETLQFLPLAHSGGEARPQQAEEARASSSAPSQPGHSLGYDDEDEDIPF